MYDCLSLSMTDKEIKIYAMNEFFKRTEYITEKVDITKVFDLIGEIGVELSTNSDDTVDWKEYKRVVDIIRHTDILRLVETEGTFWQKLQADIGVKLEKYRKYSKWIIGGGIAIGVIYGLFASYHYTKKYAITKAEKRAGKKGFISRKVSKLIPKGK